MPIEDAGHRAALRDLLSLMWADNRQAWVLGADGTYTQRQPPAGEDERGTHRLLADACRDGGRSPTAEFSAAARASST